MNFFKKSGPTKTRPAEPVTIPLKGQCCHNEIMCTLNFISCFKIAYAELEVQGDIGMYRV